MISGLRGNVQVTCDGAMREPQELLHLQQQQLICSFTVIESVMNSFLMMPPILVNTDSFMKQKFSW